mmetsp:Transcript_50666/g.118387  ORF Transcript_50666/g.118387 Transcript_50666/m.118387 type:complete len:230 (-) Transcript_50666:85-774(-)
MLPWATADEGYANTYMPAAVPLTLAADGFLGNRSLHTAASAQRPALLHLGRQPAVKSRSRSAARRKTEQDHAVEHNAVRRAASLVPFRQRRFATPISSARGPPGDAPVHTMKDEVFSYNVTGAVGEVRSDVLADEHSDFHPNAAAAAVPHPTVKFADPGEAAVKLQRWWRKCAEARREAFEQLVDELMAMREFAAEEVQRMWRGYLSRKRCLLLRAQANVRGGTLASIL